MDLQHQLLMEKWFYNFDKCHILHYTKRENDNVGLL